MLNFSFLGLPINKHKFYFVSIFIKCVAISRFRTQLFSLTPEASGFGDFYISVSATG